eukprot:scaffold8672_cov40-Cyclotella_meneghiniana.AAC.1
MEMVQPLMDFYMTCGQGQGGDHKHALQTGFTAVISVSPGFQKWTMTGMEAYLGQTPRQQVVSPATPAANNQVMYSVQQQASQTINNQSAEQSTAEENKKKTDDGTVMTEMQMSALMGFCGVSNWRDVPALYVHLRSIKDNFKARDIIREGMLEWQRENGIEIHQNIFLPEDLIKNIRAVKPNPTLVKGTSRVSDVEFTALVCLPLRPAEIEAKMFAEQAAASTEANRTKNEKEKQLKGESRDPPSNYWAVKLTVATTAALMSVCYGEKSRLYKNLMHLYEVLTEDTVAQASLAFTPAYCRQITWAIIDDMKIYFGKRVMPEAFKKGFVVYPQTKLSDIFADIQFQREINRRTLPYSWRDTTGEALSGAFGGTGGANSGTGKKKEGGGRGGSNAGSYDAFSMYPFGGQPQGQYVPPPPPPGPNPYQCPPVGTPLGHLHPKMRLFMTEYHKVVKRHQFHTILQRGGIGQTDLPMLRDYVNPHTGKSTLCWNYLTGECFYGSKCYFVTGHVPGNKLPDAFVEDAIQRLKSGVEGIVASLMEGKPKVGEKRPYGNNSSGGGGQGGYYGPSGDRGTKRR